MKQTLKTGVFYLARAVGLFALARRKTARHVRILGYHGGSLRDEHAFSPGTFMTKETFESRLDMLTRRGYPVLGLGEALKRLEDGTLPPCATVITIDDGWYGTLALMVPALEARGLAATLYVSTYYMEKDTQVFNMYAAYLLCRPTEVSLDLAALDPRLHGRHDLQDSATRDRVLETLIDFGERELDAEGRQNLLRRLAAAIGQDAEEAEAARLFTYMSPNETATLPGRGVALELHTHRHFVPEEGSGVITREIADNRAALGRIAEGPFTHFCYPSGVHDQSHFPYLEEAGIASAVTTEAGLASPDDHPYALPRILDSEILSPIEFEAEMSGFVEMIRQLRRSKEGF